MLMMPHTKGLLWYCVLTSYDRKNYVEAMGFIMLLTLYPNRPHRDTISNTFAPNLHGESENWGPLHKGMLHSEANFGGISLLYGANICSGGNPGPMPKHCEKPQI